MARPRLSEGFTRVHNELIERVFSRVSFQAYEWRVLWAVIRMSWGWNQRGCYTSYRELSRRTGMDLRHVARTVKGLVEKYILVTRQGRKQTWVEINTDYLTWRIPEREGLFTGAEVTNNVEAASSRTVASTGNTPGNGALPHEATVSVASTGNGESSQTLEPQEVKAHLKKVFKEIFKETE